jgi:hypothetical protein
LGWWPESPALHFNPLHVGKAWACRAFCTTEKFCFVAVPAEVLTDAARLRTKDANQPAIING